MDGLTSFSFETMPTEIRGCINQLYDSFLTEFAQSCVPELAISSPGIGLAMLVPSKTTHDLSVLTSQAEFQMDMPSGSACRFSLAEEAKRLPLLQPKLTTSTGNKPAISIQCLAGYTWSDLKQNTLDLHVLGKKDDMLLCFQALTTQGRVSTVSFYKQGELLWEQPVMSMMLGRASPRISAISPLQQFQWDLMLPERRCMIQLTDVLTLNPPPDTDRCDFELTGIDTADVEKVTFAVNCHTLINHYKKISKPIYVDYSTESVNVEPEDQECYIQPIKIAGKTINKQQTVKFRKNKNTSFWDGKINTEPEFVKQALHSIQDKNKIKLRLKDLTQGEPLFLSLTMQVSNGKIPHHDCNKGDRVTRHSLCSDVTFRLISSVTKPLQAKDNLSLIELKSLACRPFWHLDNIQLITKHASREAYHEFYSNLIAIQSSLDKNNQEKNYTRVSFEIIIDADAITHWDQAYFYAFLLHDYFSACRTIGQAITTEYFNSCSETSIWKFEESFVLGC